ncbi:MAG TPA: Ca2+-dependent phosphoinositide-specific phospholipase C, partial [Chitinophagales bacterium]|nr:Ca2+-dependent phosphoinositide-specific phospholipase C [Chitinophagales bacterium]
HIPDFDFNTTNYTLVGALSEIKKWSDANPSHLPVFINIESETEAPGDIIKVHTNLTKAAPFDSAACDELDREVKQVFGENLDGVITPDMVRGNYNTLEEAVLAGNWPTLAKARGKVVFIIDYHANVLDLYKAGHPSFKGRTMFVYAEPGTPEAAFVIMNGPYKKQDKIQEAVRKGYIVRTRADDGTHQAREGDYTRMNAAFSSGAQIISTDYYRPDYRAGKKGWSDYHVVYPQGHMARIDTVSAPGISITTPVLE